jgi:hypothetical protein
MVVHECSGSFALWLFVCKFDENNNNDNNIDMQYW